MISTERRFGAVLGVLAVAALALAVGLAGAAPAAASYTSVPYCDHGVSAYSECSDTPGAALWDQNIADYLGSGTVNVCERGDLAAGGEFSRKCANNEVDSGGDFGYYYNMGVQTVPHVGNNSAYYHTIDGLAAYVTGGPHLVTQASTGAAPEQASAVPASALPVSLTSAIGALQRPADAAGEIATLSADGDAVALKATADAVCLASTASGGFISCESYASTAAGDLQAAIVCSPFVAADRVVVYGVVPNGATRVTALTATGALTSTVASGNTYRFELAKQDAASVTGFAWSSARGAQHAMSDVLPSDLGCAA